MTLDEQIRERLAKRPTVFPGMSKNMREHYRGRFDEMADALLAVLEIHKREHVDGCKGGKGWDNCASCRDTNWGGPEVPWPCETVDAIAKVLGIEASDA